MYREFERPLTDTELAELERRASTAFLSDLGTSTVKWTIIWVVILSASIATGALLINVFPTVGPFLASIPGVIGLGSILGLMSLLLGHHHLSSVRRRFNKESLPNLRKAIAVNTAKVKEVRSPRCAFIQPFEDEGAGYIFDVGGGQLLFLKGQEFELDEEADAWPNSDFTIVRTVCGKYLIKINCNGDRIEPAFTIQTEDCLPDVVYSDHEEIVHADLQDFVRSLSKNGKYESDTDA